MNKPEEDTTRTVAKTLWSETILEILYETVRRGKSDRDIRKILKDVSAKGFKCDYVVNKVRKLVDEPAAERVRSLFPK